MKYLIDFASVPEYVVVDGMLGKMPIYKIKRVQFNTEIIPLAGYYFCKLNQSVVSLTRSKFAKAKVMKPDKYRFVNLRQKLDGTSYTRPIRVPLDEVQYCALSLI